MDGLHRGLAVRGLHGIHRRGASHQYGHGDEVLHAWKWHLRLVRWIAGVFELDPLSGCLGQGWDRDGDEYQSHGKYDEAFHADVP